MKSFKFSPYEDNARKMMFSIKDFYGKYGQISRNLHFLCSERVYLRNMFELKYSSTGKLVS